MPEVNVTLDQIAIIVTDIGEEGARRLLYVPEPGQDHGSLIVPDDLADAVEAALSSD